MKFCLSRSKQEVTMQERKSFDFPLKVLYENRYCNQDDFSVLVCGGKNEKNQNMKSVFKLMVLYLNVNILHQCLKHVVIVRL